MVEADLARWYHIDYRDRWRSDLTLRRLWVLIRHLPAEAALAQQARGGKPQWTLEAHLLDDLRLSLTGSKQQPPKPHPTRPTHQPKRLTPERSRKLAAARRRAREHRQRLNP